jgi:hypothetical protein
MGRPRLPIGAHGRIRVYKLGPRRYRARAKFRDHDGVVREIERTGPCRAAAEIMVKTALRERGRAARDGEITGDTTVADLGELWLREFDRAVRLGRRSPTTAEAYRYRFERHVRDGIGALLVSRWRARFGGAARLDQAASGHERQSSCGLREIARRRGSWSSSFSAPPAENSRGVRSVAPAPRRKIMKSGCRGSRQ